jgi:hypothetical protein
MEEKTPAFAKRKFISLLPFRERKDLGGVGRLPDAAKWRRGRLKARAPAIGRSGQSSWEVRSVFNPNALMLNILFGSIGVGYFVYGKKQGRFAALGAGLLLMVVPYFISNNYILSAVCVLIMLTPKFIQL